MRILVLDDDPRRYPAFQEKFPGCRIVASYDEAVEAMHGARFSQVWLDHDIGGRRNGCDVAFWMTRLPRSKRPRRVTVHSHSMRGALAIYQTLFKAGFNVRAAPYPP